MDVSFLYPTYLFLLLALPLLWFVPRRSGVRLGLIRTALMLFMVMALARPVLVSSNAQSYQVFILDRSESLSPEQKIQGESVLRELRASVSVKDNVSLIVVGEEGEAKADIRINGSSTSSLSAALQAASEQIPDGSRGAVTLISDGLATDRRWGAAVQSFAERGIPVNTFDLGLRQGDVYPSGIATEATLRVGQTIEVFVDVIGTTDAVSVRLNGPEGELVTSENYSSNGRITVPLEFEAKQAGYLPLTAIVTSSNDGDGGNNTLTKTLAIQDPLKVLYLGGRQQQGAAKLATLVGNGFDVTEPGQLLDETFPLENYDIVMLDDRPADKLSDSFQEHLVKTVQEKGLGLFYGGGKGAFGTGGYHETQLAEALPVEFSQRDEKKDPSVSLAIIIDSSGSMNGVPMTLAKQVARLTVRRLKPHDRVGIVEFYGAKTWAVPMQPATNKIEVDRTIGRMQANGSTILYPAIEEAYYGLKNMDTRFKHILVITDAGVEDAGFESLIRKLAKDGINLSTILVGDGRYSDIMFDMASWGKGQFYTVGNKFSLVEVNLREPSTTKLPAYQNGNFTVIGRGGEGWWGNVDRNMLPTISGYVEVKDRPGSEVLIEEEGRGHPVLASWRYGLGRVTSMMTEPLGSGTGNWQDWKFYGALLGRIISRTASDDYDFSYKIDRNDYQIKVTARRLGEEVALRPTATTQTGVILEFHETAPDIFEAKMVASPDEEIYVTVGIAGKKFSRRLVSIIREDVSAERQVDPLLGLDLARLAALTGGQSVGGNSSEMADAATSTEQMSLALTRLWPYILLLALLTYLSELLYRRWLGRA